MRGTFRIDVDDVVLGRASVRTGIRCRSNEARGHFEAESYRRATFVDRECPVETRDVPVQLVMLVEVPEHAGCPVAKPVRVFAVIDVAVAAAEIRTNAIAIAL